MEVSNNNKQVRPIASGQTISLERLLRIYRKNWKWFLLSVLVTTSLAVLYLVKKQPVYKRSAEVLIKEEDSGMPSIGGELGAMAADLGLFSSSSSVYNEVFAMQSPHIIEEVAKRLRLDMTYIDRSFPKRQLYGDTQPIEVDMIDIKENESASFKIDLNTDGTFTMKKFRRKKDKFDEVVSGKVNTTVKTPIGRVEVKARPQVFNKMEDPIPLTIMKYTLVKAREICSNLLTVDLESKDASILFLEYTDFSQERADKIINTIIEVYEENWLRDKNQSIVKSTEFINERIKMIEHDLGLVESDISRFKSNNMMPDIIESVKISMENANAAEQNLVGLQTRMHIINYLREYLNDNSKKGQLLPPSLVADDVALSTQIAEYNKLIQQRNNIAYNSSDSNPLVKDYDKQIDNMRSAMLSSIDNQLAQTKMRIASQQKRESKSNSQIASSPVKAKELLSVERQQKVKEALYIYLLQQREQNELSGAFSDTNIRVITPPTGIEKASAPRKGRIGLLGILMGFIIPALFFYVRESHNNKLRNAKDVESLGTPVVGRLPQVAEGKQKKADPAKVYVQPETNDDVNNAFRILRTNLEFMLPANNGKKLIAVSSLDDESGKTFVAMNTTAAIAANAQRVLLIDSNVRTGDVNRYIDEIQGTTKGLSNYLAGQTADWKSMLRQSRQCQQVDILPSGIVPPNPTELFANGRFAELLDEAKALYDTIIIDTPVYDRVADMAYISRQADLMLFVVRCNATEMSLLPQLRKLQNDNQVNSLAVVVNAEKNE